MTQAEIFFLILQIIVALLMIGAVPWAFVIERRLAGIEASISVSIKHQIEATEQKVVTNEKSLKDHEARIIHLES